MYVAGSCNRWYNAKKFVVHFHYTQDGLASCVWRQAGSGPDGTVHNCIKELYSPHHKCMSHVSTPLSHPHL